MTPKQALEEGPHFTPQFDENGLIVCVTVEAATGAALMIAYMNREALDATLASGVMTYWSRSRRTLWRKGDTSGQVQRLGIPAFIAASSTLRGSAPRSSRLKAWFIVGARQYAPVAARDRLGCRHRARNE
jgi:hypothetical protein